MSDSAVHEVAALAYRAQSASDKLRRAMRRVAMRAGLQTDYRRVFCDPATGEISEAGTAVLRDLARQANFGRYDPGASNADLRANDARRAMLLHIIARIDAGSDELLKLQESMRETKNG